jgi:hypothetical protein
MNYYDESEGTLLSPLETSWRCETWLLDTSHLMSRNRFEEYVFSFQPQMMEEFQALLELIETSKVLVEQRRSMYSSKARVMESSSYQRRDGSLFCSQLFIPKLNLPELSHLDEQLLRRPATVTGYIRDSVDGLLYLQCSYVDVQL